MKLPRLSTFSIYKKIFLGFFSLLVLCVFMAGAAFASFGMVQRFMGQLPSFVSERKIMSDLRITYDGLERHIDQYLAVGGDEFRDSIDRDIRTINYYLKVLNASISDADTEPVQNVRAAAASLNGILSSIIKSSDRSSSTRNAEIKNMYDALGATRAALISLVSHVDIEFNRQVERTSSMVHDALSIFFILGFATLLLGIVITLVMANALTRPILELRGAVNRFAKGDYGARAAIDQGDEIGELAQSFNAMADNLAQYTLHLEREVEERTKQLAEKVITIDQQLARMKQTNHELEQSGKMLIRRDLELSRANERLREVDQMKTDFVSVATHQMRTPLSGVRWTLSMIIKGDLGDLTNEQRTFLMKAYESNERMIALIDDLLFTDKIESGKLVITDESTFAPDLVENVLLELQPIAARRNVKIDFIRPETKPTPVRIGAPHLRAVLQNLLENAVKYSKEGGTVKIALLEHGGISEIVITDDGIGIPIEQQDRVFTRFYRAPNAIKMETDGSGLGLYIVKNILIKHHGKVWFESSENGGSKFHVELPINSSHV